MSKVFVFLTLGILLLCAITTNANAAFRGDINQDGDINLEDVVLGLQVVSGSAPVVPAIIDGIDVDQDDRLGLPETIYALQTIILDDLSLQHQAVIVGPLSGAGVTAYIADEVDMSVEGTKKANSSAADFSVAGTFDLNLPGVADDRWVVVAVSEGEDIDHDGNGIADTPTITNLGTFHALAKAADWRTRNFIISPLTEIVWRYTENLVSTVSSDEIEIRLNDLARYLIKTDINGNGTIDWYDFLSFNPADQTHRESLRTSYDWLTTQDVDGNSIVGSLLAGDELKMLSCLDETYSYLMTRFVVADSRYNSVKITLSVLGQGSAVSEIPYTLAVDSTTASPTIENHIFLPENNTETITFTAAATPESRILSWSGCDSISSDLTRCTVPLSKSQSIVVNFGRTTSQLRGTLHNLSNTTNYVYPDSVTVFIPADMADLIDEMALAAVDDFIVGDDNGGFLRRIAGITQNSSTEYVLTTVEASLDEVVVEGSGHLFKQMTNGDLEGYTAPASSTQNSTIAPTAFAGLAGVQLIPSNNPDDKKFKLILGPSGLQPLTTHGAEVTLYAEKDENGNVLNSLTASGELSLEVSIDTGVDFDINVHNPLRSELNYFKFIALLDATQSVNFTATGKLAEFDKVKKELGTITFSRIKFMVGPFLPVWVTPTVKIYLYSEGSIETQATFGISFQQKIDGGFLYNKDTGFSVQSNASSDFTFNLPTAGLEASIEGGLIASPVLKIYDTTGPAVPLKAYAKVKGSATIEVTQQCLDSKVDFLLGAGSVFEWDFSGDTKFGKMLHLDKLQDKTKVNIISQEWPIADWTVLNNCNEITGAHLIVEGDSLFSTINLGDPIGISTTLTVRNDGDEQLNWNTSNVPSEVTVSPSQGELNPGESEVVQMSVATTGLSVGNYFKEVFFYNEGSAGSDLPDEEFGNTYKAIDITVLGTITDTPLVTSATSSSVGRVDLIWDFTQLGMEPLVGFQVYATTTPVDGTSYSLIHTTNIYDRQEIISGFLPGESYSIKIRAYSNSSTGSFSSPVSVTVTGTASSIPAGTVFSNGRVWMDRNLGASRVATSLTDSEAFGDLYQWGRGPDGHEKRTSPITSINSTSDTPGHGSFITESNSPYDWRIPQNDNLWQGVSGTNNPCPSGFRLPTSTELNTEKTSWSSDNDAGAFASLKFVEAGCRRYSDGSLLNNATCRGAYWGSTVSGLGSPSVLYLGGSGPSTVGFSYRAEGYSVRCIQDYEPETVSTVVSAGQVWMDRNLGASRVATSSTDSEAYGDLYQWGRGTDGHEKRTSPTTSTRSSTDTPGHGSFITVGSSPYDWRTPQNDNLWQGLSGTNNPCPSGFRLPTNTELEAERIAWSSNNSAGAFASPLKFVVAGRRSLNTASLFTVGTEGSYWGSTVAFSGSYLLNFTNSSANMYGPSRANGYSVRCLKD